MKLAVDIKNLEVKIGTKPIIKNINLSLPKGRVIGFLGPSGAGKTTIIKTIVGLQKITGGIVEALGLPAGSPELRERIGYMSQNIDVYTDLSVKENLNYFAKLLNVGNRTIDNVISEVDLNEQANQLVSTLSGGQAVRVSLAVALLGSPNILLLDEPTVGLDPILRQKLWKEFHDLAHSDKTVIVSSHVMDEAKRCDYIVLIHEGKILASDTPINMQKNTQSKDMETAFIKLVEGKNES